MRFVPFALVFATGALAVSTAAAQEKKSQTITLRVWVEKQKMFLDPVKGEAEFREIKGQSVWIVDGTKLGGGAPTVGSELTDKDGAVWVIEKVTNASPRSFCYSKKKDPPKKDDKKP